MPLTVEAIYENGVLKPAQSLPFAEHEKVLITVQHAPQTVATAAATADSLLGFMRDATDEMDEIVAEAMRHRQQQPWRLSADE